MRNFFTRGHDERNATALLVASALAAFVCGSGCGSDLPSMAPVRGVVEFDGKPLTDFDNAGVTFTPRGGRLADGTISPQDGSFRLSTYKKGDGAIVGPAAVSVSATVDDSNAPELDRYHGVRWQIPVKFGHRDTSELNCEVVAGKVNFFRIKLAADGTGEIIAE